MSQGENSKGEMSLREKCPTIFTLATMIKNKTTYHCLTANSVLQLWLVEKICKICHYTAYMCEQSAAREGQNTTPKFKKKKLGWVKKFRLILGGVN